MQAISKPSAFFERFRAPRPTAGGSWPQKMKNPFRHRHEAVHGNASFARLAFGQPDVRDFRISVGAPWHGQRAQFFTAEEQRVLAYNFPAFDGDSFVDGLELRLRLNPFCNPIPCQEAAD